MTHLPPTNVPPIGLGVASLTLGCIGLLLFFLPILGIPISGIGVVVGLAGLLASLLGIGSSNRRWSVVGTAVSLVALAVVLAIAYAPAESIESRPPGELWQGVSDRPFVPPPAPAGDAR